MPSPSPSPQPQPPGPDRRLLLPAVTSWAAAFWACARAADEVLVAAATGVAVTVPAGLVLAVRSRDRHRSRRRPRPGRARPVRSGWAAAAVLALAAVTVVLAGTAARLTDRTRGPLPSWIRDRASVQLSATAVGDPRPVAAGRFPGPSRVAVDVEVHEVTARGRRLRVDLPMLVVAAAGTDPAGWGGVSAGRWIGFRGRLSPTEPGDPAVALVRAGTPPQVRPGAWYWRAADRVRAGLREACRGLDVDSAGLLPSLVVGDTSRLPATLADDLRAAGLTHLTAVSGANLAIVAGAVGWSAAAVGSGRRSRTVLAGVAVVGFVILARPSPSVLRAAVMAGVALVGVAGARRPRGVPVLAASVVVLLTVDPWLARSPGFALSVAATAGLLLLAPLWADRLAGPLPRPLALALAAPAAAQAACGPVLILLAPSVCLVGVPANLLADPAVAPATLLGVTAAALSPFWPTGAHLVALVGSLATDWIALVAHRAAAVPAGNLPWPAGLPGALGLAAVTTVAVLLTGFRRRGSGTRLRPSGRGWWLGAAPVVVAALVGWYVVPGLPWPVPGRGTVAAGWQVVLCDVGQGDALVLRSGTDRAVLVDTGPAPGPVDVCLRRLGVRHLDLVVVTHLHADHASGLPGALHGRDVAAVRSSPLELPQAAARAVRRWSATAGQPVVHAWAGAEGACGRDGRRVHWRVLEPRLPPTASGDTTSADGSAVNESSIALVLDVTGPDGTVRVLDLGDLETGRQQGLADRLRSGREDLGGPVDVVKVAHHGSARQVRELYARSGARIGLVGVGAGNDYGHPAPSALALLATAGIRALRTDLAGDLVVQPVHGGLRVSGSR